jgi:hypothetical protein
MRDINLPPLPEPDGFIGGYPDGEFQNAAWDAKTVDRLRREAVEADRDAQGKVAAWMRRWAYDNEKPAKQINANGRMAWPAKFKLLPVTKIRCQPDDVPLYATPNPTQGTP